MENSFSVSVFALRTLPASETVLTGETPWPCCLVSFDSFQFAQVSLESSRRVLLIGMACFVYEIFLICLWTVGDW